TIAFSRQWMNPRLAGSYSRAMTAALAGGGYTATGTSAISNAGRGTGAKSRSTKKLFDFEVNHLPGNFVESVYEGFRNQDWGGVLLQLLAILVPAGLMIFFARDCYYRRRGEETIRLISRGN